jgi:hypothetical protein
LSIDDEEDSLDHATSLVGDENTYRDMLSPATVTEQSKEASYGSATYVPPNMSKSNASAHKARNPLECSLTACIKPDTMPPKQHVHRGPNMRERQLCHPSKETSASPCSSPRAATGPDKGKRLLIAVELSGAYPHPDIKLSRRMMDASPPVQREVSPSIGKQQLSRKAISKEEELNAQEHSPMARAILSLPTHLPACSRWAAPSHP